MLTQPVAQRIEHWPIDKLVFYARNPRKNDAVVDRMCSSIREFGFKIPVLARRASAGQCRRRPVGAGSPAGLGPSPGDRAEDSGAGVLFKGVIRGDRKVAR